MSGHLCQKWRIFYKRIDQAPKKVERIVKAACVLHNVIIDLEKPINEKTRAKYANCSGVLVGDERDCPEDKECEEALSRKGERVRGKITEFFLDNRVT